MEMLPYTKEAFELLHQGAITLAEIEANGIRIDTEYLNKSIRGMRHRIRHLCRGLQNSEVMKIWKQEYKDRTNINSHDQLGHVLFDIMKYECPSKTDGEKYKTDEKTLSTIDHPFVQEYLQIKKYQKSLQTNLMGIKKETVDGFLHPFFNLHLVQTFRSSSDSPNFQNIPVRQAKISKLIRRAFIARPGHRLVEADYNGIEIRVATCYHQDPTMIEYLNDSSKDMHRDMAMECYKLPLSELTPSNKDDKEEVKRAKDIRYCGKNCFVFPQFYGDWYIDCARNLWEAIDTMKLHTRNGLSLREYLHKKGIAELGDLNPKEKPRLGTMEYHIQKVELSFWNDKFPVYNRWRKKWLEEYRKKGWMLTKTGFICQGMMKRNEIINYPVQGSAFHCLLFALIRLNKELKKNHMKSLIVGQIHDSIIGDVVDEELKDYLALSHHVMVDELKDEWDWINVPIDIEAEVTPVNGNWYEKKEMKIV